jgi:hypothetical protein
VKLNLRTITVSSACHCEDDRIQEDEMGEARSTHVRDVIDGIVIANIE